MNLGSGGSNSISQEEEQLDSASTLAASIAGIYYSIYSTLAASIAGINQLFSTYIL